MYFMYACVNRMCVCYVTVCEKVFYGIFFLFCFVLFFVLVVVLLFLAVKF